MAEQYKHPMREVTFTAYKNVAGEDAIVLPTPYDLLPCRFHGATVKDALAKAEAFKAEAVAQNEAAYVKRKEAAAERARKRKAAKDGLEAPGAADVADWAAGKGGA